jgi:Phosphotransferase enzyme family
VSAPSLLAAEPLKSDSFPVAPNTMCFGTWSRPYKTAQPNYKAQPYIAQETIVSHTMGQPRVLKCVTKDGDITAKKLDYPSELLDSEVRMMDHATRVCHVKGPKLRHSYLDGKMRIMVTNFDPGVPVGNVWKKLSYGNQKLIVQQLRREILKMRDSTQPLIGRIGRDGKIAKADPFYDPYHPETTFHMINFFASESEFDAHKIKHLRRRGGKVAASRLEYLLRPLRTEYTERFVLTHGDLHENNTHVRCVRDSKGKPTWELSGILDWGNSGFYPEYMEYAKAMKKGPSSLHWRRVMKKVLQGLECSKERLKAEELATEWAIPSTIFG